MKYCVDLPLLWGDWKFIQAFNTKTEAVEFCQGHFGADDAGMVCLISEVEDDGAIDQEKLEGLEDEPCIKSLSNQCLIPQH